MYGDQSSFAPDDEERFVAPVAPVPGWSTIVIVTDPRGRPVPDVEIRADGAPVGRTDAHGELRLRLDREPDELAAHDPAWSAVSDPVFPPGLDDVKRGWRVLGPEPRAY